MTVLVLRQQLLRRCRYRLFCIKTLSSWSAEIEDGEINLYGIQAAINLDATQIRLASMVLLEKSICCCCHLETLRAMKGYLYRFPSLI